MNARVSSVAFVDLPKSESVENDISDPECVIEKSTDVS